MKETILEAIEVAIDKLIAEQLLPEGTKLEIHLDRTRDKSHGDFATSAALSWAKVAKMPPRSLAEKLISALPSVSGVSKIDIAGPGFINFFLDEEQRYEVIRQVLLQGEAYGASKQGEGERVLIEFVSANPTGPLHVGHGRGAAFGASLARLLKAAGYQVECEYYVNDAGRQMDILAVSIWIRYLQHFDVAIALPENAYQGDYVVSIANDLAKAAGELYCRDPKTIMQGVDHPNDAEATIDQLIANAKSLLSEETFRLVLEKGLEGILADIEEDLMAFGVPFDSWFSERQLFTSGAIEAALTDLETRGHLREEEGALWFNATAFGDDKDRVLRRANGQTTYFASDVAYHRQKYERGFTRVIDIFGADHHGYVARIKASLSAMGYLPEQYEALLVQFAILYRGEEKIQMSTRSGSFVTLRELREEVGNDAARFFYVMRKPEQHLDFDLELAKSQSNDNPVYYIQYAYARVSSVLKKCEEKAWAYDASLADANLQLLIEPQEEALIDQLARYPDMIDTAARNYEPHNVAHYLRELAGAFHTYYNAHRVLIEESGLRNARLALSLATQQVIANGLALLSVRAPESM